MSNLSSIIGVISQNSNLHICIHDVSGILSFEKLQLEFDERTHSTPYCTAAKETVRGYSLCTKCKHLANTKAINTQNPFCGYCPFGLFEAVYPVCVDNRVLCIVYVGNAIPDKKQHREKLTRVSSIARADTAKLLSRIKSCEVGIGTEAVCETARVVADYIRLIITDNRYHHNLKKNSYGWAVAGICDSIENKYNEKLSLKNFAQLYFMNEKYLGRLFKNETGKSFNEYLNEIRLEKAHSMLLNTDKSILEIAFDCGYQSVNYFNRLFLEKYKAAPSKFRKKIHRE